MDPVAIETGPSDQGVDRILAATLVTAANAGTHESTEQVIDVGPMAHGYALAQMIIGTVLHDLFEEYKPNQSYLLADIACEAASAAIVRGEGAFAEFAAVDWTDCAASICHFSSYATFIAACLRSAGHLAAQDLEACEDYVVSAASAHVDKVVVNVGAICP
jgi:hypothetical protein